MSNAAVTMLPAIAVMMETAAAGDTRSSSCGQIKHRLSRTPEKAIIKSGAQRNGG
jgi:hypothetical protein